MRTLSELTKKFTIEWTRYVANLQNYKWNNKNSGISMYESVTHITMLIPINRLAWFWRDSDLRKLSQITNIYFEVFC